MPVKSYKDRNGKTKYYCSFYYTDSNGERKRKKIEGFSFSRDAKQAEKDFLDKIAGNTTMTFRLLSELYLKDCKARLKPTTYKAKEYFFNANLINFFKDKPVCEITPAMIRDWQNQLLTHTPPYSQTYMKTCSNWLSAFFNFAVRYYNLKNNPVRIAGSIGKSHSGRLDFWTVSEYKTFMQALKADTPFSMAFELLFYTGMREGELLALTVTDIDTTAETISINKTLSVIDGKIIITPPKTPKSKRIVTIPQKVAKHLQNYINSLYDPQPTERLFPMLNKYSLGKMLKKTATAANVKIIRVHDIRHSHASLLIELGFPPLLISERLGHERIETTLQIYSHLYPNKASEVAKKLNNFVE